MKPDNPMNQAQQKAVTHDTGPMLVLAGPGSGKTLVVTRRVRYLITERHVPPDRILVITFTKAAAREMKGRFLKLMGGTQTAVTFGTFHSVYFHIIRQICPELSPKVLTEEQKIRILQNILRRFQAQNPYHSLETDSEEFIQRVARELGKMKNTGCRPEEYHASCMDEEGFLAVAKAYEAELSATGQMDFDDMLLKCRELLSTRRDALRRWQEKFLYILIDEFQDSATRFRLK